MAAAPRIDWSWVDDAQVCEGVQRKRYAAEPGVTVEIEELA